MMRKDLNRITLTGRLGADPEARYTQDGTAVTTFRVASNRSYKNAEGQTVDETEWFKVVAWDKLGEVCGEYLQKGSRVYIEGRLKTRAWQDHSGQTRYSTEVVANELIMLDSPPRNQPEPAQPGGPQATQEVAWGARPAPAQQPGPTANAVRWGKPKTIRPRDPIAYPEDEELPF
jgi:single-strand DNA-binding protein